MLYIYIGKSAAGKDYLYRKFLDEHPYAKEVVSYTTRPIRPGEVDGVDYHYVSKGQFLQLIDDRKMLEYRSYNTLIKNIRDTWYYGSPKLEDVNIVDYAVVIDPDGAKAAISAYGVENSMVTYAMAPDDLRTERAKKRGGFDSVEWARRLKSDNERFNESVISNFRDTLGNHFVEVKNY